MRGECKDTNRRLESQVTLELKKNVAKAISKIVAVSGIFVVIIFAFFAGVGYAGFGNTPNHTLTISKVILNKRTVVIPLVISGTCSQVAGTFSVSTNTSTIYLLSAQSGYLKVTIVTVTSNPPSVTSTRTTFIPTQNTSTVTSTSCPIFT